MFEPPEEARRPAIVEDEQDPEDTSHYITEPNKDCYRDDIWKNLLEQEAEKPAFQLLSPQLGFRGTLVCQLRELSKKLGLGLATLHSAVNLLDMFMEGHRLRQDRLLQLPLACISLAAKCEEKKRHAPTLKQLCTATSVEVSPQTFKQLELKIGQHVNWRLLAPTAVTFAALLAPLLVYSEDLKTRDPKVWRRFKRDAAKLLDAYLDLTLCDVRLKFINSVHLACACVACARADLGLTAWPQRLATTTRVEHSLIASVARLLHRMMEIKKSPEKDVETVSDQYQSRDLPFLSCEWIIHPAVRLTDSSEVQPSSSGALKRSLPREYNIEFKKSKS